MVRPSSQGITIKKQFGQHFLRDQKVVEHMLNAVKITPESNIFEIGCGDGFLTREILAHSIARLWIFEIDPEWAAYVGKEFADQRMHMFQENILDVDFERFRLHAPWTLLANLPYQITFPILHMLQKNRELLCEGVVMIQEEVAQKIVKTSGRGYGYPSLFFQYYFDWKLLDKVPPSSFLPPPKVTSRLIHFKPRTNLIPIPDEPGFWRFIKLCFHQPRRTLKNNLSQTHYDLSLIDPKMVLLRAQQLNMADFLALWDILRGSGTLYT